MIRNVLIPMVASFLSAGVAIPLFRWLAGRFDVMDRPAPPLKTHGRAVPYLGGGVVVAGVAFGLLMYPGRMPPELSGLLGGAFILFLVGLADDLRPISPYVKLVLEGFATALAIAGGLRVSIVALPPAANYFLTVVWMLAMTNAFNIIDVHDGLCSGTASLISAGLLLVSVFTTLFDKTFVTVSAAALAGASAAFFLVNRPPARMFLGDAGSLPMGFLLSGLAIGESYTPDHLVGLLVPFLLFLVPLYDLLFVVVLRLARGQSPIRGSPDHIAIRLRALGWSDGRVLSSLLGLSAAAAVLAPGAVFLPFPYAAFLAGVTLLSCVGIGMALAAIRPTGA